MADSAQQKLTRVRPPRVKITYDVETGGAIQMKELPFLVGVMADLSGKPEKPLPKLKDRKIVEIDHDNFDNVLASMTPRLAFQVDNKLQNDGSKMNVELNFKSMESFEPLQVIEQIDPLRKLLEARRKLSDLLAKLDGNDDLDQLLSSVLENTQAQSNLKASLGNGAAAAAPAADGDQA